MTNESSLYDFDEIDFSGKVANHKHDRDYWMSKIKEIYGIDLSDVVDVDLNIAKLGSELEKRLEWKRIEE